MFKPVLIKAVLAAAAGATTLALFGAVVSLADSDRAALLAERIKPTTIAAAGGVEGKR